VSHHIMFITACVKCSPSARMQAVDIDATRQQQVQ